jgi:hypothetical protein
MLLSKKPEERRKSPRYPLERLAEIHIGAGTPPRLCLVIDFSASGVRLNCSGFDIPDEFVLFRSGDSPALNGTYRVVWRIGAEIGAKFISPFTPDV